MIENVLSEVGDEQIVPPVVIIITNTTSLAPPGASDASFQGYVGKGAIAVVAEKMRSRLAACGKALESGSVDQEDVEPAVIVVIVESNTASRGFEQVFVLVLAAKDRLSI